MRARREPLAWTPEEFALLSDLFFHEEAGTARCVFCRPDDAALNTLIATGNPTPGMELHSGRNIYSLGWVSGSPRDSLALARKLRAMLGGEGAIFAYHHGDDCHRFVARRAA